MTYFDAGETIADRMRSHAAGRDHLYGVLMREMASDWERGGPVREICRGWDDAPAGSVVQLRLLGGLFRIVLTGRAPELEPFYPALGGSRPADEAWPTVREVLARHIDELHQALDIAPQTNEVGRSRALLLGIFEAARQSGIDRVRLLEPGASAGLNLLVDRFRFVNPTWSYGPEDSPLRVEGGIEGHVDPVPFEIVERRGCDLSPVNPHSADGQLRLRSFIWPFEAERHADLSAALAIAQQVPVVVDQAGAGEWLEDQLFREGYADILTVVWHSISEMYWPASESARVHAALAAGGRRQPVAHVAMEYRTVDAPTSQLTVTVHLPSHASTDPPAPIALAAVGDHGVPVTVGAG
jgi:hypothetical protein